jgi:hypothetical protein
MNDADTSAPEETEPTCSTCDGARRVVDGDDRLTCCPDCAEGQS